MTIPDFQSLMLPILKTLSDGVPRKASGLKDVMSEQFGLTEEEASEILPSGGQTRIGNRTQWALTHMYHAGLIARPDRGIVTITDAGRATVAENLDRVDMKYLRNYESYQQFRKKTKSKKTSASDVTGEPGDDAGTDASPEDLIQTAVDENTAAVEGEILTRVRQLDPKTFERLVLKLLGAMGYGKAGSIEHSGKSGDGGVDGIISQDPLGLDRVYMQAKRYSSDNSVGRPTMQEFVGALHGKQADRGVFITTSSYTKDAREYAEFVNARLVLIDGDELASLMVSHGVGVQPDFTAVLHRIDEDFFDAL